MQNEATDREALRERDPARLSSAQPAGAATGSKGAPHRTRKRMVAASRLTVLLAVLATGATILTVAMGYGIARHNDVRLWSQQREALRTAVAEFRALFGRSNEIDPRFVRMVEQSAGIEELRFEAEPAAIERETQPVTDSNGRIVGFFTWKRSHPMAEAFAALLPIISGVIAVLFAFSGLSLWLLRRVRHELAASEEQVRRAADEDRLTGLPNHAKTLELLDLALAERKGRALTTFALIELDGMDDAAAQIGALGSDQLLAAVAARLQETLPENAICGRIGSDEFAVIVTADFEADVEAMIRGVLESLARPHWIDAVVRVSAHVGFAQAPRDAQTRAELTRKAELAVRIARQKGPGSVVAFTPAIDSAAADQSLIRRELARAISANELELHYQPIVAANGGGIVGVEALLRWEHGTRGQIPPATFVPVAEQMGLMDTLGAFVLRRALQDAKRWPGLYMAVNLSPLQVRDRSIVELVRTALVDSGVAPSRVMLEITEGVLIDNPEEMVKRIEDLHALGVRIALDDFGSGYSNLGYLQRFPLDKLKIDRSFVAALGQSDSGGVLIQAMVALGRALGLSVTVEGVETEAQRVLLRLAGCDEMQGYLFAKPAPAKVTDRLLATAKSGGSQASPAAPLTA